MTPALTFEPHTHTYCVRDETGLYVPVPSATQVLSRVGLTDFSHIPEPQRTQALDRGRRVHTAAHLMLNRRLDHASVDPTEVGYIESCARFIEAGEVDVAATELALYHPGIMVAGTTDALGIWLGARVVLDWCCGDLEESRKDLQTAFYAEAARLANLDLDGWNEFKADSPIVRLGVRLRRDGKLPKAEPYRYPNDFRLFAAAAAIVHEQIRTRRKGVTP